MKLLSLIQGFLRPANVFNIPKGQQGVDAAGANGLIGLMNNLNAFAWCDMASYATTGNAVTLAAGDIASNPILSMGAGATGGYTITTPTTAAILAALGASVPQDGSFSKIVTILPNGVAQTGTLTAGDATQSIVGTNVIGSNVMRSYIMRVLQSSIVFTNVGFNFL